MKAYIFAALLATLSSQAYAAVEPNYAPDKPPVTNPWYATQDEAARQADLGFIAGMKPHHEGALTMSQQYLNDPAASDLQLKQLAKGIIENQTFEIGMMARVRELVEKPIQGQSERRQIAEQGLAQKQRFTRAPMPGPLAGSNNNVSKRDVEFAKAMIVHHQGALDMCRGYLGNAATNNKYLELLCVDILNDQAQEIRFMQNAVSRYPGNPDDVKIDASMVHGMEGMSHGHHDMGHKAKAAPKAKAAKMTEHGGHEGHH